MRREPVKPGREVTAVAELSKSDIEKALDEIISLIDSANAHFEESGYCGRRDGIPTEPEAEMLAEARLEDAFVRSLILFEALGLLKTHEGLRELFEKAKNGKNGLLESRMGIDEPYLIWAEVLRLRLNGLSTAYNVKISKGLVAKDVSSIIRACAYTITDPKLFPSLPAAEADIHARIEGTLKAYFPDLKHKPTLTKPIKSFIPDTGLPSIKTLIEYKFISTEAEAKAIADEILADTRGYHSRDWKEFLYVIYETTRVRTEEE